LARRPFVFPFADFIFVFDLDFFAGRFVFFGFAFVSSEMPSRRFTT
jgi:hypothetical protein